MYRCTCSQSSVLTLTREDRLPIHRDRRFEHPPRHRRPRASLDSFRCPRGHRSVWGWSMNHRTRTTVLVLVCLALGTPASAQAPTTIRVEVRSDAVPISDAEVIVNGTTYKTATDGIASIPVAPGTVEITVL